MFRKMTARSAPEGRKKEFRIEEGGLAAGFRVRENGTVELAHFTPAGSGPVREEIPPSGAY